MSLTIENEKFTIFGSGYEKTRNDSGLGTKDPIIWEKSCDTAVIDETETYVWTTQGSGVSPIPFIRKRKLEDLSEVAQTVLPDTGTRIFHPTNVSNNYGIAFQNYDGTGDIYVIDLTTDELYLHISGGFGIEPRDTYECILVGTNIYFITRGASADCTVYKLDLNAQTWAWVSSVEANNGSNCGFVDDDSYYCYEHARAFYRYNRRYGYTIGGVLEWSVTAEILGGTGFPYCGERGLCEHGNLWLPTYTNGKWHLGKYNGNTGGDFNTPTPLEVIGKFDTTPEYSKTTFLVTYSDGRTMGAWYSPNHGLLATNFDDVFVVNSGAWYPLAMTENIIFARNSSNSNVAVFEI